MFNILFEASTAHIKPTTNTWLMENDKRNDTSFIYDRLANGYLFFISDHEELRTGDEGEPQDLHELITVVKKISPNCTHIILDADGPMHELLEVFNWE